MERHNTSLIVVLALCILMPLLCAAGTAVNAQKSGSGLIDRHTLTADRASNKMQSKSGGDPECCTLDETYDASPSNQKVIDVDDGAVTFNGDVTVSAGTLMGTSGSTLEWHGLLLGTLSSTLDWNGTADIDAIFNQGDGAASFNDASPYSSDFTWRSSGYANALFGDASANSVSIVPTAYFGDADDAGSLNIADGSGNYVSIDAPALASDYNLTLPSDDGAASYALITDGNGNTSWTDITGISGYEQPTAGYWQRNDTTLSPATAGDNVQVTTGEFQAGKAGSQGVPGSRGTVAFCDGAMGTSRWLKFRSALPRDSNLTVDLPRDDPREYEQYLYFFAPSSNQSYCRWTGDKQHFFGQLNVGLEEGVSQYINMGIVSYSDTIGDKMCRYGTVTGISATAVVADGSQTEGTCDVIIRKNSHDIKWKEDPEEVSCKLSLSESVPANFVIFAPGDYIFIAGDVLQIYIVVGAGTLVSNLMVDVEYVTKYLAPT